MTRCPALLTLCATAVLSAPPDALAAHDRGVPIRPSGPASAAYVPGQLTQFWRIRAVHPRRRAVIAVTLWAGPPRQFGVVIEGGEGAAPRVGHFAMLPSTDASRARGGVRLAMPGAAVSQLTRDGDGWRLLVKSPEADADIRLTRPAAGIAAGPWRLQVQSDGRPAIVRWATPAPLARARVRVRTPGGLTEFSGGQGYLDHTWGSVDLEQRAWHHWDLAQIATGPRSAVVLHGLNNSDELSGPGSIDGVFRGVLVRVSPRGTTACRPQVARRRWISSLDHWTFALRTRARCGGETTVFDAPRVGFPVLQGEPGVYWRRVGNLTRDPRVRRSSGTADHLVWDY